MEKFNLKKLLIVLVRKFRRHKHIKKTKKKIITPLKKLKERRYLNKDQKEEIIKFFKTITGKKISLYCHEYFYSRTGIYSKEYIPMDLYELDLLPRANRLDIAKAYDDKNLADIILPGIKHPETILKRMNGYFYSNNTPLSKTDAIKLCQNIDNAIIKPSFLYQGEGIQNLDIKNGKTHIENLTVNELFERYGYNFQIQKRLEQHKDMAALNPTSVNTLRILTYRLDMDILLVYVVIRIGKLGSIIDNQCAGGISAKINEDGRISKYAYGGYNVDKITHTDTGIKLEGYKIPAFEKAINTVKKLHLQLPYFNIIGWDIAIDKEGEPVLIEWNTKVGLSQSANGPGFDIYAERILKDIWNKVPYTDLKD